MAVIVDLAGFGSGEVVSPSHAPTDRDFLKFAGSSMAVVNEVPVTAPSS